MAWVDIANGENAGSVRNKINELGQEMQTFDDENNLLKYDREVTVTDTDGNPTEVQYTRPIDDSLFLKRNYSNADASGFYQTIVEQFYETNGSTVYKTITYTLTYLENGLVETMARVVV